jgi:hypothetical protein
VQRQLHQEAGGSLLDVAVDHNPLRPSVEPVRREAGGLKAFVLLHHRFQDGLVVLAHGFGRRGAGLLPLEEGSDHRVVPVQVDVVEEHALLLSTVGLLQARSVVVAGPVVQFGVPVGVAPAQVGDQRFARYVVREES